MSDGLLILVFVASAGLSLGSGWVLVTRLERVGARLGLSEALLGILAALAADAPEITAAVTALAGHQARIGAGVVIGSNVFNLAALLGLSAVLAGGIALHRRVIVMEGVVALWVAAVCVAVIVGLLSPPVGLLLVLCVLVPYLVVLGVHRDRLRRMGLPAPWVSWLTNAIVEEELELEVAIHPRRGRPVDGVVAAVAVLVVVGASLAMEQSVSTLGARYSIPEIVVGGLVLAGVTSLPNAVAAVYLSAQGRSTAALSTAMNSNALNVAAGLLLPATIVGLGGSSGSATLVAAWYFGLTAVALGCAYVGRGLRRWHGAVIICAYVAFVGMVLASAYSSPIVMRVSAALAAASGIGVAAWMIRHTSRRANRRLRAGRGWGKSPRDLDHALAERAVLPDSDPAGCPTPAMSNGPAPPDLPPARDSSLIAGWPITAIWCTALAISSIIAATDAILGHHIILIWLLMAGPCCGLLTGRWAQTATAGAWAAALAVLLGVPDGIWGTWTHLTFLAPVLIVAVASTASAAFIEKNSWNLRR